jgi:hypothetical protein
MNLTTSFNSFIDIDQKAFIDFLDFKKFKEPVIYVLNQVSKHVQNTRFAVVAVIVTSIFATEVTLFLARQISKFSRLHPDQMSELEKELTFTIAFPLIGGAIIGINYSVFQSIKLPLSPLLSTAISIASIGTYLLMRTKFLTIY